MTTRNQANSTELKKMAISLIKKVIFYFNYYSYYLFYLGNVILNNKEHVSIETDPNVETITNKAPNYEKDTQTEFKIEKKVERHYMKEKVGEDIGT